MVKKTSTHTFHDNFWSNLRVERNIPLRIIARRLHKTTGSVGNYFVGLTVPNDDTILKICEMFNVPFEQGKAEFNKGHANYVFQKHESTVRSNSTNKGSVTKGAKNKKSNYKQLSIDDIVSPNLKHDTAWRRRFAENHISVTEFAKHIGKERSSVAKYISGRNRPPKEVTQMFADYFKISYAQAATDFQEGYEKYHNIEHKHSKQLVIIEDTSTANAFDTKSTVSRVPENIRNILSDNDVLKELYGKIDVSLFMKLVKDNSITMNDLKELYSKLDSDTFIKLAKFLKQE